jgi:U32 family peptidase
MMNPSKKTILLSPAGSYESLHAAIKAGADAVYFGVGQLNMRARASKPFSLTDLAAIADLTRDNRVESYLALNTLLYDDDLPQMRQICDAAKEARISAVIATDIAAITYGRSLGLPVHISTQANISNIEAVKYYARYADVVVLAREPTL